MTHPDQESTASAGLWGGAFSNVLGEAGDPRFVAGFNVADFEESDGSAEAFVGAFVSLSESFRTSAD